MPALPAFPRQVLARWASVLGSVLLYLGQSQAPASPFLAERELKALHWESCCVRLQRSLLCHRGGGLSGRERSLHPVLELLRGDGHPREALGVLGSGRKPCPRLEMPFVDLKLYLPPSVGRDLSSIALLTMTV